MARASNSEWYDHNDHCLIDKETLWCLREQNFKFNSSKNVNWWYMGNLVFDPFEMFTTNNSAASDEFVMKTLIYSYLKFHFIAESSYGSFRLGKRDIDWKHFVYLPS